MRKVIYGLVFFLQAIMIAYLIYEIRSIKSKLYGFQKKTLPAIRRSETQICELQALFEKVFEIHDLPREIKYVPFGEKSGVVISAQTIHIPGVIAPYNASIIENGDSYLLFFRYDVPVSGDDAITYNSYIGCVELDKNFLPLAPFFTVDTNSSFSEDPRIAKVDGSLFLIFNDLINGHKKKRGIRSAEFNIQTKQIEHIQIYDNLRFSVEKNWMPFGSTSDLH